MQPRNPILEKLTFAGRLLFIVHLVAAIVGSALYIITIFPDLAPGHYPFFLFVVPVLVGLFVSFLAFAWLLERCGINIYRRAPPE